MYFFLSGFCLVKKKSEITQRDHFTFQHFLLAVPHDVDVFNAHELEFDVGVVIFVLIAFPCSSVRNRIQLETHDTRFTPGDFTHSLTETCFYVSGQHS